MYIIIVKTTDNKVFLRDVKTSEEIGSFRLGLREKGFKPRFTNDGDSYQAHTKGKVEVIITNVIEGIDTLSFVAELIEKQK